MKLNTKIKTLDGRIGTICYSHFDGEGGVWGEHTFIMPESGFGDELPEPVFMLRKDGYKFKDGRETVVEWEIVS